MSKYINKTIWVDGRYWTVLKIDEYLEVFYVVELEREFKTTIGFEEV